MYQNRRQSAPSTNNNHQMGNSLSISPSNHRKLSPTNSLKGGYGQTPRSRSPYNFSPKGSLRGNRPGTGNSLHVSPPNSVGFSPVGGPPSRFPARPVNGGPNKYRLVDWLFCFCFCFFVLFLKCVSVISVFPLALIVSPSFIDFSYYFVLF